MAGRPKQFDPSSALDRAMMLFWEKGYEGTSMCDLLSHMGIARQSLYDTFGDKRSLYLAALDHYYAMRMREVFSELFDPHASLAAIQAVFERIGRRPAEDAKRACMMSASAMERGSHDPAVGERVKAQRCEVEACFERAVRNAMVSGEVPAGKDARAIARHLLNTVQGLNLAVKGGADREHVRDVVDVALSVLH